LNDTTLTTKVPVEMAQLVLETGYSVSDVMQVGLDLFLRLSREEQGQLILSNFKAKKKRIALRRLSKLGIS